MTLAFGPAEKATLAVVGLTIIASISGKNIWKRSVDGSPWYGLCSFRN